MFVSVLYYNHRKAKQIQLTGGKNGHHNIDFCYHRRIYRIKLVYATGRLFGGREISVYKCTECGNLFEEGEQATWEEHHGLDSPPYEKWSGCPVCKGSYEEVYQCKECGDWHTDDELYDGWCEKCLRETINYDTFFEYCEANKDENYLDTFVMCYLLNCDQDEVPKYPSWEFHHLMVETYKRGVANAKLLGEKFGFLEKCIRFIMEDDGYSGRENYAEWLNNRKVVK